MTKKSSKRKNTERFLRQSGVSVVLAQDVIESIKSEALRTLLLDEFHHHIVSAPKPIEVAQQYNIGTGTFDQIDEFFRRTEPGMFD